MKAPKGWQAFRPGPSEEGACDGCGDPVYSGDPAYTEEGGGLACSTHCARRLESETR